ncbi:MAG: SAM-dependent methyltransferase [Planctomycetes bacterium]|nr:SAM-dependent methyltransferase [Planctomycetota bacterium]
MNEVSNAEYWKRRWNDGETGWDLGGPCPVFRELLDSPRAPPKGRVALPGCGAGHDLRLFLEHGYEARGFDFAFAPQGLPVDLLDVFELGTRFPRHFDLIVEYTCYCAIDPARREEYIASLRSALAPGGHLLALLFPVGGEGDGEGPPYAVREEEITTVLGKGMELLWVETPKSSVEPRLGRERLAFLRKS